MSSRDHNQDEEGEVAPQCTCFCPYCNINLAFPAGSQLIQCPQCNNTLDPKAAHQIRCTGCKCLLAYPPDSQYIQCPKCLETMDPRQVGPAGTAGSAPPASYHSHSAAGGAGAASTEPKKRRDPNAPKAVCNAYMIFCKSRRAELKNELPELAFGKIGAKLGEMWRNMTSEEKKPYEDRAMVDRERYRKEMVEYTAGRGEHGSASKRAKHEPEPDEHDQKLARDVSQQQAKAAQRARRETAQRHHQEEEEEEEEASGRSFSGDDGQEEEGEEH